MKIPTSVPAHVLILHRHAGLVAQYSGRDIVAVLERRSRDMCMIQKQLVFSVCA